MLLFRFLSSPKGILPLSWVMARGKNIHYNDCTYVLIFKYPLAPIGTYMALDTELSRKTVTYFKNKDVQYPC